MDKKLLHGAHTALVTPMKDGAVSYDDLATLLSSKGMVDIKRVVSLAGLVA